MHTKDIFWCQDIPPPANNWPLSPTICPLLISIHFTPRFMDIALSEEGVKDLKMHALIGARDYYTLEKMQEKGIPSYFSGCLTLTLDNPYHNEREDIIYAVDITQESLNYLREHTGSEVIKMTHSVTWRNPPEYRLKYAEGILDKYRRSKCVITERLHAAMPCLGLHWPADACFIDCEGS